ncbi:Carbon-nitrogen hydrolase [Venustampulla echinocandica]|uniref:Carbon-nitrogen hydrolase n=1 Tax=Venustampulla echinocandica TaxID=2656787 RepID=A0A370TM31_9HELO|nr:Carbon-nitrogen hydrolase [Venustampulla echinocandica]RDL36581.1 Carbon-nitrogen hydrolase [Venustampulla echinocandica]
MAPVYKIAVIQLYTEPLAMETNFRKATSYIREAAAQSCDLAVLPEYHLTGWVPHDPGFLPLCSEYKKYLDGYCSLAKELNICIVPGTILEKHTDEIHNIAYFISNTGSILGQYQKKNLWHPERPHLTSSRHTPHQAFDTPLGKVGMLICWDLAFPEAFRELIAAGAKIIIIPTFWGLADCSDAGLKHNPGSEALFLESTLVSRCFENTCMVVFVNAGGPKGEAEKGNWAGLSQVAVPFKGALGKMNGEEGMSIVDVDMQILEDAEDNYKVRQDIKSEGWHYDYSLRRQS